MRSDLVTWAAVVVLFTGLLVLVLAVVRAGPAVRSDGGVRVRRRRPAREQFRPEGAPAPAGPLKRAGVVVNPTKFTDVEAVRETLELLCAEAGWGEPIWLETTIEDPGTGQAQAAVRAGASVVCALGGDGTVRAVAAALAGTDTPMGLLPAGTGNLLARNLDLPLDRIDDALGVALTGQNKRVDVGMISIRPHSRAKARDHVFLVMAGLGFDAAVVAEAPERLKSTVGWLAYTVSGVRNLRGTQFRVQITVDDEPSISRRVRTVVIGNCGRLQGGLVLMPEARLDDGWLDAVVLSPKGLAGWAAVGARLISQRRRGHDRVEHLRLKGISILADELTEVQIDGDSIGTARQLSIAVKPSALVVRVG